MFDGHLISYHAREVSWTVPITVAADAEPGDYPIAGLIGFMTCKDGSAICPRRPGSAARCAWPAGPQAAVCPLQFAPAKYEQVRRWARRAVGRDGPRRRPRRFGAQPAGARRVRSDRS